MNKKRLKRWLKAQIKRCESDAEEYVQELDSYDGADAKLEKAQAFQEVLDFIKRPKRMMVGALMEGSEYSCVISFDGRDDIKIPSTSEINAEIIKRLDESYESWTSKRQ